MTILDAIATPKPAANQRVLLGLIGAAIGLSRSPALYQGECEAQGLTCLYQLIDLDRLGLTAASLPELLTAAQRFGFAGLNITYPCKQAVIPLLDSLSPDAAALGAVNTVVLHNGKRVGHNTDWSGYAAAFQAQMPNAPRNRVVQFGTGGAGSAVAYALLKLGTENLALIDTDTPRAEALATQMSALFPNATIHATPPTESLLTAADGIVNATPVGMAKFPGTPFPTTWLRPHHWVSEIIYFPLETELLAQARALGCQTIDGAGMNVHQAADAFRLYTGLEPNMTRLRAIFDAAGG